MFTTFSVGALDLLKNLNKTNITLAYSLFLPKLNRSGFSLQDLINQTQVRFIRIIIFTNLE